MLKEYDLGDIYIRHAIDESPEEQNCVMHVHERYEIYFFVSGKVDYLVEGAKYPLGERSLMVMRPGESHAPRIYEKKRYERYAINFPASLVQEFDPEGRLLKPFAERPLGKGNLYEMNTMDMDAVSRLVYDVCYCDEDDYGRRLMVVTHLFVLLEMIYRAFLNMERVDERPQNLMERMVRYVNKHLFEKLSVPMLAEHFYLSPSQFGRVFRQATGAAPWEYITKKRLMAAREKLSSGISAKAACEECGFTEYSVFYRAYVKQFGCSPKQK